jgi:hypothetical protein
MKQKATIRVKALPQGPQLNLKGQTRAVVQVDQGVWSIECTVDELQRDLYWTTEEITIDRGYYVDGQKSVKTLTVRKYYRRAKELMKWIPIARPAPEFVINASDLSPKVIEELEVRADNSNSNSNSDTIGYILKQAVGRIFENIDFDQYHISIARSLKVRIES